jgi:type I restriction enzyme S subunit
MNVNQRTKERQALPSGWRWVELGEVCAFVRGVTFDKAQMRTNSASGFISVLRAGNIQDALNTRDDLIWVPEALIDKEQYLHAGDVAICLSSGSASVVGKTAYCAEDTKSSVGVFCGILRARGALDNRYLSFWLRSKDYHAWRNLQARGTNIQNLRFSEISMIRIPLPPLVEQKRIAAILNEQMAAVEKARAAAEAQLEAAKALSIAYYKNGFGYITPLSARANPVQAAPGWKWRLLKDVARLESGHTPSRYHPEWWGGEIPWLALPDIRDLDGRYAYETREYTNPNGIDNSSARILPAGTVCFSRTASVGYVTILGRPMATSQDFVNWVCGPDLDPEFLMHLFKYSREYFISLASGAIHKTVYMPTVKKLSILAPGIREQKRIAAIINEQMASTEQLRTEIEKQLHEINSLPAALLKRAFRGEL